MIGIELFNFASIILQNSKMDEKEYTEYDKIRIKDIIEKATIILYLAGTICGLTGFGYICWKCYTEREIIETGLRVLTEKWWIIIAEIALMVINISLETWRWRELNKSRLSGESFITSMKTINESILMSLGTIGGIGEHIGKARNNKNIVRTGMASVYGSIIQTIIIIIMALIGVSILGTDILGIREYIKWAGIAAGIVTAAGIVMYIIRERGIRDISISKRHIEKTAKAAAINVLKYGVFSYQMYLMLKLDIASIDIKMIAMIFVYYGVITIIPSASFGEIGIRGSIAAICFETMMVGGEIWASVAAMMVWIINRMIPGLAGCYSIIFSVSKSSKNQEEAGIE